MGKGLSTMTVKEAYDKWKHLDGFLSQRPGEYNIIAGEKITYDLWQAVKAEATTYDS